RRCCCCGVTSPPKRREGLLHGHVSCWWPEGGTSRIRTAWDGIAILQISFYMTTRVKHSSEPQQIHTHTHMTSKQVRQHSLLACKTKARNCGRYQNSAGGLADLP
ncbi:unnamed protein product, partial [Sphacelaria rigidula]